MTPAKKKLNLTLLAERAYDATIVPRYLDQIHDHDNASSWQHQQQQHSLISHCPWTLQLSTTTHEQHHQHQQPRQHFLTMNYADIRRLQNESWATSRLEEGVSCATGSHDHEKAEELYREGLSLCPTHTGLLIAMGALRANQGSYDAALALFQRALDIDPAAPHARDYWEATALKKEQQATRGRMMMTDRQDGSLALNQRPHQQHNQRNRRRAPEFELRINHNKAIRDAMVETNLAAPTATSDDHKPAAAATATREEYPMLSSPFSDADDEDDLRKSKKKKKTKKSQKRKRKKTRKRDYDSSDSSPDDDDDDDDGSRQERRRHQKKRKKKRRKQEKR